MFTNLTLLLGANHNCVIQCARRNSSLKPTLSFVKIAMEVGVFVTTTDRAISYEMPDLDTDCEMILA